MGHQISTNVHICKPFRTVPDTQGYISAGCSHYCCCYCTLLLHIFLLLSCQLWVGEPFTSPVIEWLLLLRAAVIVWTCDPEDHLADRLAFFHPFTQPSIHSAFCIFIYSVFIELYLCCARQWTYSNESHGFFLQ